MDTSLIKGWAITLDNKFYTGGPVDLSSCWNESKDFAIVLLRKSDAKRLQQYLMGHLSRCKIEEVEVENNKADDLITS